LRRGQSAPAYMEFAHLLLADVVREAAQDGK